MLDFLLPFNFLYQGVAYYSGVAYLILHFLLLGSLISTGSAIWDCRVRLRLFSRTFGKLTFAGEW